MDKTYQDRLKQAEKTVPGDVWRHRKTMREVVVISRIGRFGIGLSHASGRKTMKLDHYLASDYELLQPDTEPHK